MIECMIDSENISKDKMKFNGNVAVLLGELSFIILNVLVKMSDETGIGIDELMTALTELVNDEANLNNMKDIINNEERSNK